MGPQELVIADARDLRPDERTLVTWLLEHGVPGARDYLAQVAAIRLISRCGCGCASLNFEIDGKGWPSRDGMKILSDHEWRDPLGHLFGIFLFAKANTLAGIDVYSVDGLAVPRTLPDPGELPRE
jgi:hypothetical protein